MFYRSHSSWDGYQPSAARSSEQHLRGVRESKFADGLVSEVADFRSKHIKTHGVYNWIWGFLAELTRDAMGYVRNHKYLGVFEFEHGVYTPNYCHLVDETWCKKISRWHGVPSSQTNSDLETKFGVKPFPNWIPGKGRMLPGSLDALVNSSKWPVNGLYALKTCPITTYYVTIFRSLIRYLENKWW